MEWLEILLGSGLLITLAGWFISLGVHKREHQSLRDELSAHKDEMVIAKGEIKELAERQNKQDVVQATIVTSLQYITQRVDEIVVRMKEKG